MSKDALPDNEQERWGLIKTRLNQAASAELATHQAYRKLRHQTLPKCVAKLKDLIETADSEDFAHHDQICAGLYRLGSAPQTEPMPGASATAEDLPDTLPEILRQLRQRESLLISTYQQICTLSLDLDYRIFDLAFRNLQENSIHLSMIDSMMGALGLPKPGSSTHFASAVGR